RMKAGGVKFADTPQEARGLAEEILRLRIKDLLPVGVLVEEKQTIEQEYYAAVTWDGRAKKPVIIFSDMGGIDIEEVAESHPEQEGRRREVRGYAPGSAMAGRGDPAPAHQGPAPGGCAGRREADDRAGVLRGRDLGWPREEAGHHLQRHGRHRHRRGRGVTPRA